MAKNTDNFAMSDDDEFIENGESTEGEGGDDDSNDSEGSDGAGEKTDDDSDGATGNEDDEAGNEGGSSEEGEKDGSGESEDDKSKDGEESSDDDETDKGESEDDASKKEESGSGESGDEEDFFSDLSTESDESGKGSGAVDFKKLGSIFDVELEEDTEAEFATKINKKIDDAKQDVDLSKFDPEARKLVKHLNDNEGKIGDFFVNPKISSLQNVLSQKAEDKFKMVRRTELSSGTSTAEEIEAEIDEELGKMSAQQIVGIADKIDNDAKKFIADEINEIVGQSEAQVSKRKEQAAEKVSKRKESLKNYVHKQDNFLGLKLTDKTKATIAKDIETGNFDKVVDLDDSEIALAAYMIKRSGGKMKEAFSKQLAEASRKGSNKATDKHTDRLHKNKDEAKGAGKGHQEESKGKKNLDNWGSMDL